MVRCNRDCFNCVYDDCVAGEDRRGDREKARIRARAYYWRHRETILARNRAYREANPDYHKKYYQKHRERILAKAKARREREANHEQGKASA